MRLLALLALIVPLACGSSGPSNNEADTASSDDTMTDGSPVCEALASAACSLMAQDCPAGEGCFLAQGGPTCAPSFDGADGSTCVYENDCAPGFGCVQLTEGYACARLCATTSGCESACDAACPETYGKLTAYPGLGFCTRSSESRPCELLAPDCPLGQACYYASTGIACSPTASNLPVGSACGFANDCVAFAVCVNGSCGKVCDPASVQCPAEAPRCAELPDAAGAGVCLPEN